MVQAIPNYRENAYSSLEFQQFSSSVCRLFILIPNRHHGLQSPSRSYVQNPDSLTASLIEIAHLYWTHARLAKQSGPRRERSSAIGPNYLQRPHRPSFRVGCPTERVTNQDLPITTLEQTLGILQGTIDVAVVGSYCGIHNGSFSCISHIHSNSYAETLCGGHRRCHRHSCSAIIGAIDGIRSCHTRRAKRWHPYRFTIQSVQRWFGKIANPAEQS